MAEPFMGGVGIPENWLDQMASKEMRDVELGPHETVCTQCWCVHAGECD